MASDVKEYLQRCDRCICRKTSTDKRCAGLVNMTSTYPMELVCMDYLSLEVSKGGYENILVITDHFTRYSVAIPTRNQTAQTTARVLYDNFLVHYGFPARLHSDQGRNFESAVIKQLCHITGIKKSRTTSYHAMGNGMVERFNQTLLGMLGTLTSDKKSNWKEYVPSLVHSYNGTKHESTGFSPFFLMFGRHPRLPIDIVLGIAPRDGARDDMPEYVQKMKKRLSVAYDIASSHAKNAAQRSKQRYDMKVRESLLEPGDRVLVRNVGLQGKCKLADKWNDSVYVVLEQPHDNVPVFVVRQENGEGRKRTLHRNLLLSLASIPLDPLNISDNTPKIVPRKSLKKPKQMPEPVVDLSDDSSSDESGEVVFIMNPTVAPFVPRPVINTDIDADESVSDVSAASESGSHSNHTNEHNQSDLLSLDDVDETVSEDLENPSSEEPELILDHNSDAGLQNEDTWSEPRDGNIAIVQNPPVTVPPIPAPRRSNHIRKPPDMYGEWVPPQSNLQEKVKLLMQVRNCCPQDASSISSAIVQLVMNA